MVNFSAVCLFCEDIREEKSGQDSIIGTLPDTVKIEGQKIPASAKAAALPKIGFYFRVNFNTQDKKPKQASVRIENMSGRIIAAGEWKADLIEKAYADALQNDMPLVGLLVKVVAGSVPIALSGEKLTAIVTVDGVDRVVGAVRVILPTASEQPAAQSPSAS